MSSGREKLRPVPGETLVDVPKPDPVMDSLVEGFRYHALEFQRRHIESTPGHQPGCAMCMRIEAAIKEIGGGDAQ